MYSYWCVPLIVGLTLHGKHVRSISHMQFFHNFLLTPLDVKGLSVRVKAPPHVHYAEGTALFIKGRSLLQGLTH